MSREATGGHQQILGSTTYFSQMNRTTFWGNLPHAESFDYKQVLRELASRADSAISRVYDDLQKRKNNLTALPESNRKRLAKQVAALYDVSSMGGGFGSRSSECISMLESSGGSSFSFFTKNELAEAAKIMKNSWEFSSTEVERLVEKAAKWGIDWAADGDKKKKEFLEEVENGKGQRFLEEVLETYREQSGNDRLDGYNGYQIGSDSYLHCLEHEVFCCDIPTSYGAGWGNPQYTKLLKESLLEIVAQIQQDLEGAHRNNWYVRDENAAHLREALQSLEKCGVSIFSLSGIVDKLSWYTGGDSYKIRQLQQKLNAVGTSTHLTEDGVYGKKTHSAWLDFINKLEHGTVPTLAWTDLTQSKLSGIKIGATKYGDNNGLKNAFTYQEHRYIHFDPPHSGKTATSKGVKQKIVFPHINLEKSGMEMTNSIVGCKKGMIIIHSAMRHIRYYRIWIKFKKL